MSLPTLRLRSAALFGRVASIDDQRVITAGSVVAVGVVITQLVTVVKELLIAKSFGAGDSIDAYLIALVIPSFAINIIAGSFASAVIPTFMEARARRGHQAAQALFSSVVTGSVMLLSLVALALVVVFPRLLPLLAASFSPAKRVLTERIFYVLAPMLVFSGAATILSAVLNAEKRFVESSIAPVAVPATTILALVAFGPALGVYALAAGVVGGFAVQVACLGFTVRRVGYSLKPAWDTRSSEVRTIISQYVPMVAGAALMSGTALVDQSMAAMLPSGSVATLGYAFKVPAAVLTMVTAAVGTVVLPHFSGMVATRDWKGMAAHVRRYAQIATLWTTLATVALIAASHPTIRLLFQRGAFTVADTMRVANAQSILLAQLPFYVVGILFVRVTSALKRNDVLWWGAVISFPLNVGGNLVLMRYLGVNGIALSTVIVYVVSSVYLGWSLRRILRALIVQGTQKNAN